jgi:hypothetical protein
MMMLFKRNDTGWCCWFLGAEYAIDFWNGVEYP